VEENTSKVYVGTTGVMAGAGNGSALFVINLCASIAPVQLTGKNLPGLDNYRLYQVARVEDGRTRHRLRLGFFLTESHAESVLTVVRQQYPTAFTTCLCDEDRKFARGYLPESAAPAPTPAPSRPVAVAPPAPVAAPPAAAKPAPKTSAPTVTAQRAAPAAPTTNATPASRTLSRAEPEVIELTWEPDPAPKPAEAPAPAVAAKASPMPAQPVTPAPAAKPAAPPVAPKAANTSTTARVPALSLSEPAPTAQKKAATPASTATTSSRMPALSLAEPPPPPGAAKDKAPSEPFHVGKGVSISESGLSLHTEAAAPKSPAPAAAHAEKPAPAKAVTPRTPVAPPAKPAPSVPAKPTITPPKPLARAPVALPGKPALETAHGYLPELDTTQTIRALTADELNDDNQEKYFAIQLAASEQPVNLDTMPRLDIFEAYRLYSVAIAGSGRITHSLRLGFFKEAVSAEAVSGYLKTFFGSPTVLRVSVAEHTRFKDAPQLKAGADAAPRGEAKVVELNNARGTRPVPTVTQEVPTLLDTGATGSFKTGKTGSHKTLTPKLKPAAKSGGAVSKSGPAHKKTGTTGKHKALQPRKSLSEALLDEAREVELSESGIRRLPKNDSLLSRLVDKLTK
jgi:hypothetical protein